MHQVMRMISSVLPAHVADKQTPWQLWRTWMKMTALPELHIVSDKPHDCVFLGLPTPLPAPAWLLVTAPPPQGHWTCRDRLKQFKLTEKIYDIPKTKHGEVRCQANGFDV